MPEKKEDDEVFYIGIKDPIEIRRSLLESSKETVQYLQRFERFKQVRAEKTNEIKKLKEMMHDIHVLVKKLKSALPKTKLRAKLHRHEEEVEAVAVKNVVKKTAKKKKAKKVEEVIEEEEPKKPATELEKLEEELGEIEGRLTKLV